MEYAMASATIVKVHRHGQGAKGGLGSQAIGQSKGGMITKILALTDALGVLIPVQPSAGHRYDTIGVPALIEGIKFNALIADKAYDTGVIIAELNERGVDNVVSQHPRRTQPFEIDSDMYTWHHLIENFSANSRSSNGSLCERTKPTRAFPR